MKRDMRKAVVVMALTVAAGVALLAVVPAGAQAASGCFTKGPDRTRTFATGTQEHYKTWYCSAYQANDVLNNGDVGDLFAGTSWFVCQKNWGNGYPNPPVGSARNT